MTTTKGPYAPLLKDELLAFLKTQRPDVDARSWGRADLMTVLPWLLPAYVQYVKNNSQDSK